MPISSRRKEYRFMLPVWQLIDDCLAGEFAVKAAGMKYLPDPSAENMYEKGSRLARQASKRYDTYRQRAVFYVAAQRTLKGLEGEVFQRDPVVEVPDNPIFKIVEVNADGKGRSLKQVARQCVTGGLSHSRGGVFVDYTHTENGATREQLQAGEARPFIRFFRATQIINWRYTYVNNKKVPSLIVILDERDKDDDGYEVITEPYYIELRLVDGVYTYSTYSATASGQGQRLTGPVTPTKADGSTFKEIPFRFMGSEANTDEVEIPLMYALCSMNIAHYRNSADEEESGFIVGQPTPCVTGVTAEWIEKQMGGSLAFGSRGAIVLPPGATAELLQAKENAMISVMLKDKEARMIALGAKFVEASQIQRTATEASIDNTSETSVLQSVASNAGELMEWALGICADFIGIAVPPKGKDGAIAFELNTEFDLVKMTPEERAETIKEWQAGAITFTEMRDNLRRGGIASLDDDEAKAQTDKENSERALNMPGMENDPNNPPSKTPVKEDA
jgi:hypothetical protein